MVLEPELLLDKGPLLRLRPRVKQQFGHAELRIQANQIPEVFEGCSAQRDPENLQRTGIDRRAPTTRKRSKPGY
jgi:hypothetical protein